MSLRDFKKLIDDIGLDVPDEWYTAIEDRLASGNEKSPDDVPKSWSQERKSLLKLVAGMACEQYGFDPNQLKNSAVNSIQSDLDMVGIKMDAKTIRKWVGEAVTLVDGNYWEK
ncbi:MAG: hypothetical protein AAFY09_11075 [Pseudomonadota bacterium]